VVPWVLLGPRVHWYLRAGRGCAIDVVVAVGVAVVLARQVRVFWWLAAESHP